VWKRHLEARGVVFKTNVDIDSVTIKNHRITQVHSPNLVVMGDIFVFSCSLRSINRLMQSTLYRDAQIFRNLQQLEKGCMQLYFTVNLYFTERYGDDNEVILTSMPWQPIVQKKRSWSSEVMHDCDDQIKDVWNVGVFDLYPGIVYKKILRNCTPEQAVEEIITQLQRTPCLNVKGRPIRDAIYKTEYWYQFVRTPNGGMWSTNPKFSTNAGYTHYMPHVDEKLPIENMHLSAYYVRSTWNGASMEASCEVGTGTARHICAKHSL
jgi:hypothetical protein